MLSESTIPDTLRTRDQWICWEEERQSKHGKKVPLDPRKDAFALVDMDQTWSDLTTALEYIEANPTTVDGLGFVLTSTDPIVGIDLNGCRDPETGQPTPHAKTIIELLDSYTEVSTSGTGYRIFVNAALPPGRNRCEQMELRDRECFFTITGDHVAGTPEQVEYRQDELDEIHTAYIRGPTETAHEHPPPIATPQSVSSPPLRDDAVLRRAKNASNGALFDRLWNGSTVEYTSKAQADMALCQLLAFWTGGHAIQMDRLFRRSNLSGPGWNQVQYADGSTYGQKTIARALEHTSEFYDQPSATRDCYLKDGDDTSQERDLVYLREKFNLACEQLDTLETQLEEKQARIRILERRLEMLEGRSVTRELE